MVACTRCQERQESEIVPWQGPYTVVKRLSDVVYRIELVSNKRKRLVVHFNRLKPCYIDQSIENQLGHRNKKCISRTQTKRDLTIEGTGRTVTQGTSNQDTGTMDDDEEEWVVITIPQKEYETSDTWKNCRTHQLQQPKSFKITYNNVQHTTRLRCQGMRKHGQVLKSVTIQWTQNTNQVLYKLQYWKDTREQEGSQTGYLIINDYILKYID